MCDHRKAIVVSTVNLHIERYKHEWWMKEIKLCPNCGAMGYIGNRWGSGGPPHDQWTERKNFNTTKADPPDGFDRRIGILIKHS